MPKARKIDYDSSTPPYRQLAGILREQIRDGTWTAKLPGERALQQEYGVALITIRKALALLREEGLIETVPGWGTFVVKQQD